ncbi:MAG: hypothetical protein HKN23_14495 [Verrucomicrobiales bacterium]|nr:hypothetical protein [Verrucomicrobiales bacterium]
MEIILLLRMTRPVTKAKSATRKTGSTGSKTDPKVQKLVARLRNVPNRPLVLVTGPSGGGKSQFARDGLRSKLERIAGQNSATFHACLVDVSADDTPSSLVRRCVQEIWEIHPELRRQSPQKLRELLDEAKVDPIRVGKKLFSLLRGLEMNVDTNLAGLRVLLVVDGLEKLLEEHVGESESFIPLFGTASDPFGFLRELLGLNSLLITLSYREWIAKDVRAGVRRSRIPNQRIIETTVDSPEASCDHFSPDDAETLFAELRKKDHAGVARIIQRIASSNGSNAVPARDFSSDPHLWKIATELSRGGLLRITGRSLEDAKFSLVSPALLKEWDRAVKWTTDEVDSRGARQADQFENHALSWHTTGRQKDLLLHVDRSITRARNLLNQHAEKPCLSALAFEFLTASVQEADEVDRRKRRNRRVWIAAVAGLTSVIAIALSIQSRENPPTEYPDRADSGTTARLIPEDRGLATSPAVPSPAATPLQKPVEPAQNEPEVEFPPEPIEESPPSVQSVLAEMDIALFRKDLETALETARQLYEQVNGLAVETPATDLTADEYRQFVINLGKIALMQNDPQAARSAWKQGISGLRRDPGAPGNYGIFSAELRLLMSRLARNAGRSEDATAYLPSGTRRRN